MTERAKPCKTGPRHTWAWVKNVTNAQIGGHSARFTLRGWYRCACGQQKVGAANHNGPDLRGLFDSSTTNPGKP